MSIYHSYKGDPDVTRSRIYLETMEEVLSNVNKEKIYPEKNSYCNLCDWRDVCYKIWEDDNYVNLVAGSNKSQIGFNKGLVPSF